jgi:anti-sigma factor RsiW
MKDYDENWEQQINALLDGELGQADADELKSAATDDRELARAIVEAYQLQQAMDDIGIEPAPASLKKRLRAIPRQQKPTSVFSLLQPRWVTALAAVPLLVIAVSLMQPKTPSEQEIAKARQELAIAFAYIDKAGAMTGRGIESTVGNTMSDAIAGSVIRNIKSQYETSKEKEA